MRTTKLPSTWYSTIPMNKPLNLVKSACFECFGARGFALGGGDEVSLDSELRTTKSSRSAGYVWLHHPCLLGVPIVGRVQCGGWKMGKNG